MPVVKTENQRNKKKSLKICKQEFSNISPRIDGVSYLKCQVDYVILLFNHSVILFYLEYQPRFLPWLPRLGYSSTAIAGRVLLVFWSLFCLPSLSHMLPSLDYILAVFIMTCYFPDQLHGWLPCYIRLSAGAIILSVQMLLHRDGSGECGSKQCPSPTSSALQGCHAITNLRCHSWPASALSHQSAETTNAKILFYLLLYPQYNKHALNRCCKYSFYPIQFLILFFSSIHVGF